MEPKLPSPNQGPESPSLNFSPNIEQSRQLSSPEAGVEQRHERIEQRAEASASSASNPVLPTPVFTVSPPVAIDDVNSGIVQDAGNPLVANDDDLIEKEWVDKAKKIILQTKDDPFRREQEVNKLQADYLRKRYGREIGTSQ